MSPITFAHRGARAERPENTIAAFRLALEQGASGLETDAWMSGDGQVVLVHDDWVRSGLRRRKVTSSTAEELREAADVPTLAELYETLGTDYELSIDLKGQGAIDPIVGLGRRFGAPGRLWLCTPNGEHAVEWAAKYPDVHLVHSTWKDDVDGTLERHASRLAEAGVGAMNMHHTEWTAGLVSLFHRFGVKAFAWDAQEERHIVAMLRIGIDGLYCDRPDRLVRTVGGWLA